jgi:hypothetical protein
MFLGKPLLLCQVGMDGRDSSGPAPIPVTAEIRVIAARKFSDKFLLSPYGLARI